MAQQTLDFFVKRGARPQGIPLKVSRPLPQDDSSQSSEPEPKKPRSFGLGNFRRGNAVDPTFLENPENKARHEAALRQYGPTTKPAKPNAKPYERKYAPAQLQFIELKRANPDTILFIETGFRYRAFGEDAAIVAKACGFKESTGWYSIDETLESDVLYTKFATFGFPLAVVAKYVKKMVNLGYKVAIVAQSETAAIKKAGTSKSGPFKRQVDAVYTRGTYINDFDTFVKDDEATGTIMAIYEYEPLQFAICCVRASTGDIIYDQFKDTPIIGELETRVMHLEPCELLLVGEVSPIVSKLVETVVSRNSVRVEKVEVGLPDLDKTKNFSNQVQIAIQCVYNYLEEFGLQSIFELPEYSSFNISQCMYLEGNTLTSLEILENSTDNKVKGSLFWVMDRTRTKFGQRMFRKWVSQPLFSREALENRVYAVEQLVKGYCKPVSALMDRLKQVPDLERLLTQIHYGRITPKQLYEFLHKFHHLCSGYTQSQIQDEKFKSSLLVELFETVPTGVGLIEGFLRKVSQDPAQYSKVATFFYGLEEGPIADQQAKIKTIEEKFHEFLKTVEGFDVEYINCDKQHFLIQTKVANVKKVPANWQKCSGTKAYARFKTPETIELLKEYDLAQEELDLICEQEFRKFLDQIKAQYGPIRAVIRAVAHIDCLLSLADLSCRPLFTKAEYVDDHCIEIIGGRHPVVDELLTTDYIPNDTKMYSGNNKTMIITGPNMGGKSSYVRQCALIVIMAQIGSFVPAQRARICMVDAIYTRMGAYDNMMKGESTFQVELKECANILEKATSKSLVLLDEIGRGTSTVDGVAIAYAVLDYMITTVKSFTLFITHYPQVTELAKQYPKAVQNWCMEFNQEPDSKIITFLYRVIPGISHRSYGINVARLAKIPEQLVEAADAKSQEFEQELEKRRECNELLLLVKNILQEQEDVATLKNKLV